MLKDQYLQTIIGNLGIAISPENNSEIIIKLDVLYDKKSDVFTLSNEYKIFYQDYGTIITDFQNTDFSNKENLIEFFNKYCLFGLENKKLISLFNDGKCSSSIYNSFVEKMVKKYKKSLISYQKDINSILDYCVFSPNKKTALSLFTQVYNNKAYKASRYKDITDYELDYKHFQQIGKKKVNSYKSHKITQEEFIKWINQNK